MATFKSLSVSETNENHRRVFEILAMRESNEAETRDGYLEITLDSSELSEIRGCLYGEVREDLANDGAIQSASELRESLCI